MDKRISLKILVALLISILVFGLSACSLLIKGFYGIKKPKEVDDETILKYSKKYDIPLSEAYKLDTAYLTFLFSFDSINFKEQIKNHYQPLQALYYDKNGQLKSFQINCYAGGFPNLKWNRNGIFTSFPAKKQAPVDSLISLNLLLEYMQPLRKTIPFSIENYYFIVIVFWNVFMGRQSKRLIRYVWENTQLAKDDKVKLIYVNNDPVFVH